MAREYIVASQDLSIDNVTVHLSFDPIGTVVDVTERVETITEERTRAAELERSASHHARELAHVLAAADVPVRDIGAILHVSHQRAHQLLSSR